MAKLTYWVAESIDDGSHGSIAGKTKKAVLTRIADCLEEFEPVVKRTVFYTDAFDLMIKVADLGDPILWV